MRVGELIRIYRAFEDFNIRDFAKELDISSATLSRIERGENMDGKTLAKIVNWILKDN